MKKKEQNSNFIKNIIAKDLKQKKYNKIITRFPPEPNGFLHLGHARAIIINFELSSFFKGKTYLRYDDTNPQKEKMIFVDSILENIKWLGYNPDKITFASDYFEKMYKKALILILKNKAYVDDLSAEQIKKYRGDINKKGINSPFRNRSIQDNLDLFKKMKKGFFKKGEKVLRAKIDMSHANINLRDPVLYRILDTYTLKKKHWFIFPSYDYAHPLEDAIEKISHSLCSLEFEDHKPLYNWILKETEIKKPPTQIEFGRLNITNTSLSKRNLNFLVENNFVKSWDDPRMPTLSGLRRRGYTPESIKNFILEAGVAKNNTDIKIEMMEHFLRKDLEYKSKKAMAIINPLKVTITNYPENKIEFFQIPFHPNNNSLGQRKVFFSKYIYIEKEDFSVDKPDKKYKRLFLNGEVRLLNAYFIKAYKIIKDNYNNITEILVTYDKNTKSGTGFKERKPNGTIHFVEQKTAKTATFNFFQPLFKDNNNLDINNLNLNSLITKQSFVENSLEKVFDLEKIHFIRHGYFNVDQKEQKKLNFNEIVPLKKSYK
ncbi:MAG: glutaminyl-tRNA synthetase [Candidatus Phytoplasma cynodontis]|uniref:glutamine--tRNA ligase n=1 Tax='Cynodon dactylon' phytoplasma TaxID=295320 RepID=UPI001265B9C3|nr:glutamine--tRNA ligase ['Cynodon dactylon' phytoplasma]KAB8121871.1 glutamine--tRNA ligase ['Cynodon dactylon' phytoplasma]WIA07804.1 MAG: glutaminyl-tRNA synthetase [Candidatus Phytoplasma cynodontis]